MTEMEGGERVNTSTTAQSTSVFHLDGLYLVGYLVIIASESPS